MIIVFNDEISALAACIIGLGWSD